MKKILPLLLLVLVFAGCSRHSELHESMEAMGGSFKAMRNASDSDAIKVELAKFKAALDVAKAQKILPEHQPMFDEGMNKAATIISAIETALNAGDVDAAKKIMGQLGDTRKKYHEDLGVK